MPPGTTAATNWNVTFAKFGGFSKAFEKADVYSWSFIKHSLDIRILV
jgi:hypothetical protein